MATAEIIFTQDAVGAPAGQSTDQLVVGLPVTLRNSPAGNVGAAVWLWKLKARPLDSTAVLSNAQSAVASFTPDQAGSYMVELAVNGGGADAEVQQRLGVVRTVLGGGALPPLAVRIPAAGESDEANWPGNEGGWWEDAALLWRAAAASYASLDSGGGGATPRPGVDETFGLTEYTSDGVTPVVVEGVAELGEIPVNTVWTFVATFHAAAGDGSLAFGSVIQLRGVAWRGSGSANVQSAILSSGNMPGDTAEIDQNALNLNEIQVKWQTTRSGSVNLMWERRRTELSTLPIPG